jgi:hypothetical protein
MICHNQRQECSCYQKNAHRDSASGCHLFILPSLCAGPADVVEGLESFAAPALLNSSPRFLNSSGAIRFLFDRQVNVEIFLVERSP